MQQLSLGLGIVPQNSQASTYDPYWDEITCEDVGEQDEKSNCPPTQYEFQVGDRVEMVSEFITGPPLFGTVAAIYDGRTFVRWEPHGKSYINTKYLKLAHQQLSPCKSVGGQVDNDTNNFAHQHIFTGKSVGGQVNNNTNDSVAHQHNGWIEKYSVTRNGHKYYYWRFAWREGGRERGKKQRKYIGSCTNPKARERMEMVRNAIALGKMPCEIVEMI